ncbi:MAG: DUF1848 domain-containing protein [Acetatifactor sp.]|nr:DUF1848 domain-containing protein [Acetatifactor sp.]
MILSASRRTDLPNYYAQWFIDRIKAGYCCVRNPMNPRQISRIDLSPQVMDCIVFWTKNPANMIPHLEELRDYTYYFQFTLTGYGRDIEPNLPDKRKELIPTFQELSKRIGKERVIWRYDPILLNEKYTADYHRKAFGEIADRLAGHTERVVISFVDMYAKIRKNAAEYAIGEMAQSEMTGLAAEMARIAADHDMLIESCAEQIDLGALGIRHGCCIDQSLIERLLGCGLVGGKDKNQRKECGCFESMDIGAYNTCLNGCKYCYANFSDTKVEENIKRCRVDSPLLCGDIGPEDRVTDRAVKSLRDGQICLGEYLPEP